MNEPPFGERGADRAAATDVGTTRSSRLPVIFRHTGLEIVVFVVALAGRLGVVTRHNGLRGIIGYDCGVYFAGADALIHGRMPYPDFTMLHPPGITLALTPFAALTTWMTDWHAFVVATLAFCVLGSINAVLVIRVCRRLGLSAFGSVVGGLFYAVWYGSISGEFQVKLEPLGNLFLLIGLLLLLRAHQLQARLARANILAGLVLGLTLTIKIWWGVPVVLLVLWQAHRQNSFRAGAQVALGATSSVVIVYTPFFVQNPSEMFSSLVSDQFGRTRTLGVSHRISSLTTLSYLHRFLCHSVEAAAGAVLALIAVAVIVLAWRASTTSRGLVAVVIAQFVVLFAAPSFYGYYADYAAVAFAVCIAAAASTTSAVTWTRLRRAPALAVTTAMFVITAVVTITGSQAIHPFPPAAQFTSDLHNVKCVMSVNPTVLIRVDALTRGLRNDCPNWIDVTGRRYRLPDVDSRLGAAVWERELTRYLRSGQAVILAHGAHIPEKTARVIKRDGVFARDGRYVIYRGRG